MTESKLVAIVDDDESIRESLPALLHCRGLATITFASAFDFLEAGLGDELGCLILDVAMPGMSGPDLYGELERQGRLVPTIFITAHSKEGRGRTLSSIGDATCLLKPFREEAIVGAVLKALSLPPC